jgi:translation initiation factor 4A
MIIKQNLSEKREINIDTISNNKINVLNHESNYDASYEIKTWDDLEPYIEPNILRGIFAYGFETPSPIQQKAIIPIIKQKDIIAQAQSGTGKTGAFTIGALSRINLSLNQTQVLILSPTRELAEQICNVVRSIGSIMNGLYVETLFGGSSYDNYTRNKNIPHIICGCPGRVYEMITRKYLNVDYLKLVILDEADEMLSVGFKEQIYNIFQYFKKDIQVALFSATLPSSLNNIIDKMMREPVVIKVQTEMLTLEGISQFYIALNDDKDKYMTLKDIFSFLVVSQCIIYCNSVKRVVDLYEAMIQDGFSVCCIHSNMDKQSRYNAFKEFKMGKSRVLISSNVTARGIDIQQVSIVINFDLPNCVHNYLHRIGRSGRWGRKGVGINFISRRDVPLFKQIEQYYSTEIKELPMNLDFLQKMI